MPRSCCGARRPELDFEVVGLRSPTYVTPAGSEGYWKQVVHIVRLARERPVIFIGDLGTDPATDTRLCAEPLQRLFAAGDLTEEQLVDWISIHSTHIKKTLPAPPAKDSP